MSGTEGDVVGSMPAGDPVEPPETEPLRGSTRMKFLSRKAKENKFLSLKSDFFSVINTQLPHLDEHYEKLKISNDLTLFDSFLVDIDNGMLVVDGIYKEILELVSGQIDSEVADTYEQYQKEVAHLQKLVVDLKEQLEKEEEELMTLEVEMEDTRKKLAEQMKRFNDRLKVKEEKGLEENKRQNGCAHDTTMLRQSAAQDHQPSQTYKSHNSSDKEVDTGLGVVKQFTEALLSAIDKVSTKKSVEPAVFSGNVMEFSDWEVDLNTYLRVENICDQDRLRHLKKFVSGDARKCISGLLEANTNESYMEARAKLKQRYGSKLNITRTFRQKLMDWPKIQPKDGRGLTEFGDFLSHIRSAMKSLPGLRILDDCQENEKLAMKLPDWLKNRWARVVAQAEKLNDSYPTFSEFTDFIQEEAHVMMLPISQQCVPREKLQKHTTRLYQTAIDQPKAALLCLYCDGRTHTISKCFKFKAKSYKEKVAFVQEKGLCFGCMRQGHLSRACKAKLTCNHCGKYHPTVLHNFEGRQTPKPEEDVEVKTRNATEVISRATYTQSKMAVMAVPVYVSAGNKELLVYALLDTQSDACFISKDIANIIEAEGKVETITLHTLNGSKQRKTIKYEDLTLRGYMTKNIVKINAYSEDNIECNRQQIPTKEMAKSAAHLGAVVDLLPPILDAPVGLLLGMNCPEALTPLAAIPGGSGQSFAMKTIFGWTLCGGPSNMEPDVSSYRSVIDAERNEESSKILDKYFSNSEVSKMSQEDMRFLSVLQNGRIRMSEGHYMFPLPFKALPSLPNNRAQAEKRLDQLKRKFVEDKNYKDDYVQFMTELIKNRHAEEVPAKESQEGQIWYLPHFAVRHPKKKKLRVVFDASAKYSGVSLNDLLLPGPDHMNNLLGILCRFRKERIAICCDIEKMFYNFKVTPEHRDFLRFLWNNDDFTQTQEYRMTVHLFGATSSPGVATFGLRSLAEECAEDFPAASSFLRSDFYVDDGITSVPTVETAIDLIKDSTAICSKGNVHLHKFVSNSKEVLASIPASERSEKVQNIDLFNDQLPMERTLGMEWCLDKDCFTFSNSITKKPCTKRGLLSATAQIYDPLGLLAPFILKGKLIVQECSYSQQSWDDPISMELQERWAEWIDDLNNLRSIEVPRWLNSNGVGEIVRRELHHFSDASLVGYGACSYLRAIDSFGHVSCTLLLAKSRVAPKKPFTIPRLELQGAVVASRLAITLRKEMRMAIDQEFFWTDSKIVLGYISNESRRFHMFVANRVHEIKENSKSEQWNYVKSEDNPADIVSRGAKIGEIKDSSWFYGPEFLSKECLMSYICQNNISQQVLESDPEVRKTRVMSTAAKRECREILDLCNKISSWNRLVKIVAYLRKIGKERTFKISSLQPLDLEEATVLIIKSIQMQHFADEFEQLKSAKCVSKKSTIRKLNPVVDLKGLLRVGGRLKHAVDLSDTQRHPLIIPKGTNVSKIIAAHHHQEIFHLGRRSTIAAIRDAGFWLISGTSVVKSLILSCVTCAKLRGKPVEQLMGQLPLEQVSQTAPFTHVGMDVFGHFITKDKRTENKRWGLLFTCLYSRAIHIELLEDLSTDCFLNALRSFLAFRGKVTSIMCDNGTNFVGAANELQRIRKSMANTEVESFLLAQKITFKFTSPTASHQGGSWERMIRSVRAVLNGMAKKINSHMDTQSLRTAFCEAMSTVNSRPLTAVDVNNPEEAVISPNTLITMKKENLSAPPPGSFVAEDLYGRLRWRKVQFFADEFYKAWKQEYLAYLTQRQKWNKARDNIKSGDIVLLMDQTLRNEWKIGVVECASAGTDGLVRRVRIRLANPWLTMKGIPYAKAPVLERPVTKVILLQSI